MVFLFVSLLLNSWRPYNGWRYDIFSTYFTIQVYMSDFYSYFWYRAYIFFSPFYRVLSKFQRLSLCIEGWDQVVGAFGITTVVQVSNGLCLSEYLLCIFLSPILIPIIIHWPFLDIPEPLNIGLGIRIRNGSFVCSSVPCWGSNDLDLNDLP